MSLSDPIGDMLARIKNAQVRNHSKVSLPSSKFKSKIWININVIWFFQKNVFCR